MKYFCRKYLIVGIFVALALANRAQCQESTEGKAQVRHALSSTVTWLGLLPIRIVTPSLTLEQALSNKFGIAITFRIYALPSEFFESENFDIAYKLEVAPQFYLNKNYIESFFASPFIAVHLVPDSTHTEFFTSDYPVNITSGVLFGRNWITKKGFMTKLAGGIQLHTMKSPVVGNEFPLLPALDFRLGYAW